MLQNPHIAYFSTYNCVFKIAYAKILPHMRKFAYLRTSPHSATPHMHAITFLPCDAMRCTVLVIVILSVRLSVTLVHCVHMVRPTIIISFWGYHVHLKIRRGLPRARALNEGGVGTNWRFSTNKPPYLQNGVRYDKGYY